MVIMPKSKAFMPSTRTDDTFGISISNTTLQLTEASESRLLDPPTQQSNEAILRNQTLSSPPSGSQQSLSPLRLGLEGL